MRRLAQLERLERSADGAIEKTFTFANYYETIAFVNALAWIAHARTTTPTCGALQPLRRALQHARRGGISVTDFDCAAKADALLAS